MSVPEKSEPDWIEQIVANAKLEPGDGGDPVDVERATRFAMGQLDEEEARYVAWLSANYEAWNTAVCDAAREGDSASAEHHVMPRKDSSSTGRLAAFALALAACLLLTFFLTNSEPDTFRDGQFELALLDTGELTGLTGGNLAYREAATAALRGAAPSPAIVDRLQTHGPVVRNNSGDLSDAIITPYRTAVRSTQPDMRWKPLAGATVYHVELFAVGSNRPLESSELNETHWQPTRPLKRGRTYRWRVVYKTKEGDFESPTNRELAALFEVLSKAQVDDLIRSEQDSEKSDLIGGLIAYQAGLLDEAKVKWQKLADANPGNKEVKQLLDNVIRAKRGQENENE